MKKTAENNFSFKYIFIGITISVLTALVALFALSVIMYYADLSNTYASVLASVGLGTGCFVGSIYTAKKIGKKGLLTGFLMSGILFCIISIASLTVTLESVGMLTLIHFFVMMLSGGIGGIVGVNGK